MACKRCNCGERDMPVLDVDDNDEPPSLDPIVITKEQLLAEVRENVERLGGWGK